MTSENENSKQLSEKSNQPEQLEAFRQIMEQASQIGTLKLKLRESQRLYIELRSQLGLLITWIERNKVDIGKEWMKKLKKFVDTE